MPNTITPKPWQNGLFSVATRVAESEVNWDGRGWKLYSACPEGAVWCCDDSTADPAIPKKDPAPGQNLDFMPFTVYQITGCEGGTSRMQAAMGDNQRLAADWLDTNIEGWVSAGLEVGACGSIGLIDTTDVTPDPIPGFESAISRLLSNRQRDGLFDRPTLHVPAAAIPFLCNCYGMISKFADIAVGPGYGVVAPTNAVPNGGWAYITGPVEYSLGPRADVMPDSIVERRRNYDDSLEEQLAVYRFDPCGSYRSQFVFC